MGKKSRTSKQNLGDNFYPIQEVLKTQAFPDGEYCFVSWVGYPEVDNSWVRKTTVIGLSELPDLNQHQCKSKNETYKKIKCRNRKRMGAREKKINHTLQN